jgi:phosphoadenosine phosphosulfate reductase
VQYIKTVHSDVEIHRPEKTMWELISTKTMPPSRFMRYCCNVLKEGGGENRFVVTGVRWAESPKRKATRGSVEVVTKQIKNKLILNADNDEDRRMVESCVTKGKRVLNPIVDWSDEEIWWYIKNRSIKYCVLYDEGFERLGCIGCPLAGEKNMTIQFDRWPMYKRSYIRSFDKMLVNRKNEEMKTEWENGDDVMRWWTSDFRKEKQLDGQIGMDENI